MKLVAACAFLLIVGCVSTQTLPQASSSRSDSVSDATNSNTAAPEQDSENTEETTADTRHLKSGTYAGWCNVDWVEVDSFSVEHQQDAWVFFTINDNGDIEGVHKDAVLLGSSMTWSIFAMKKSIEFDLPQFSADFLVQDQEGQTGVGDFFVREDQWDSTCVYYSASFSLMPSGDPSWVVSGTICPTLFNDPQPTGNTLVPDISTNNLPSPVLQIKAGTYTGWCSNTTYEQAYPNRTIENLGSTTTITVDANGDVMEWSSKYASPDDDIHISSEDKYTESGQPVFLSCFTIDGLEGGYSGLGTMLVRQQEDSLYYELSWSVPLGPGAPLFVTKGTLYPQ